MLRKVGREVIGMVMESADRIHEKDQANIIPIGYASCSVDVKRKIVSRTEQGQALTKLQLQKDCWRSVTTGDKEKILNTMEQCSLTNHSTWWRLTPEVWNHAEVTVTGKEVLI